MPFHSPQKLGIHVSVPAQSQLYLANWYAHFLGQVALVMTVWLL